MNNTTNNIIDLDHNLHYISDSNVNNLMNFMFQKQIQYPKNKKLLKKIYKTFSHCNENKLSEETKETQIKKLLELYPIPENPEENTEFDDNTLNTSNNAINDNIHSNKIVTQSQYSKLLSENEIIEDEENSFNEPLFVNNDQSTNKKEKITNAIKTSTKRTIQKQEYKNHVDDITNSNNKSLSYVTNQEDNSFNESFTINSMDLKAIELLDY